MISRLKNGFKVGFEGFKFLFKYPKTLLSVLIFWIVFSTIILIVYGLSLVGNNVSEWLQSISFLIMVILVVLVYSTSISIASLFLLELVEQHETTRTMSVKKALIDTIKRDLIKTLPIIIIWSIFAFVIRTIQFIVALIIGIISSALHIGDGFNWGGGSSISNIVLKAVRIFMFFTLPAIAWEELSVFKAISKSWKVIKTTWVEIIAAITFSNIVFLITIIPLVIIYYLQRNGTISEDVMIYIVIALCGFVYSLTTLIQQLISAEVYLWYMKWEKAYNEALNENHILPDFDDIDRPTFFDHLPNLSDKIKSNKVD